LDSWSGVGHVAVGMHRQGFDLQLTQYDERGWRATFYTTGMEHSPTSATGTAWERTPWRATQRAAWGALTKTQRDSSPILSKDDGQNLEALAIVTEHPVAGGGRFTAEYPAAPHYRRRTSTVKFRVESHGGGPPAPRGRDVGLVTAARRSCCRRSS